jgi:hypothetical protein
MRKGLGGHYRRTERSSDIWLTPPSIIRALGIFDTDPCAAPLPRPWDTALTHYGAPEHDGLAVEWSGRVWMNPPYGRNTDLLAIAGFDCETDLHKQYQSFRLRGEWFALTEPQVCGLLTHWWEFSLTDEGFAYVRQAFGVDSLDHLRRSNEAVERAKEGIEYCGRDQEFGGYFA